MPYTRSLILVFMMLSSMGCAMCDSSLDCQYNAFGGVRDRIDRANGRVASLFDPAAALDAVLPTDAPLFDDEIPTDADLGDDTSDDEGVGRNLTEDLLNQLDQLEALPQLPNDDST